MSVNITRENYRSRMIGKLLSDEAGLERSIKHALLQGAISRQECQATIKESKQLIRRISRAEHYSDLLGFFEAVDKFAQSDN